MLHRRKSESPPPPRLPVQLAQHPAQPLPPLPLGGISLATQTRLTVNLTHPHGFLLLLRSYTKRPPLRGCDEALPVQARWLDDGLLLLHGRRDLRRVRRWRAQAATADKARRGGGRHVATASGGIKKEARGREARRPSFWSPAKRRPLLDDGRAQPACEAMTATRRAGVRVVVGAGEARVHARRVCRWVSRWMAHRRGGDARRLRCKGGVVGHFAQEERLRLISRDPRGVVLLQVCV